jgi:hypothetical protein
MKPATLIPVIVASLFVGAVLMYAAAPLVFKPTAGGHVIPLGTHCRADQTIGHHPANNGPGCITIAADGKTLDYGKP